MHPPFLVTGCGKSATVWAAALFTELGFPCLHEEQFTHETHGPLLVPEASWLAVPYLDQLPPGSPIIRIIRNPYHVVQSAMRMGFLDTKHWTRYEDFAVKHLPVIGAGDTLTRVIRWVTHWDRSMHGSADAHLFPDRYGQAALNDITHVVHVATGSSVGKNTVAGAVEAIGRPHTSPNRNVPSISDIDAHPEGYLVRERATIWGYL